MVTEVLNARTRNCTFSSVSNGVTRVVTRALPVSIIEIEDICFHDGSTLILPDIPAGSGEGEVSTEEQRAVSGVAVLALVYKFIEENPNKKLIIAGHDDENDTPRQGFLASRDRADGVLQLLKGEKRLWANHASRAHTLKDYQQIMKFCFHDRGWNCDPVKIDNSWGSDTSEAMRVFFGELFNSGFCNTPLDFNGVAASNDKRWPVEVWMAVFGLYEQLIFTAFMGWDSDWGPEVVTAARNSVTFVDDTKPYVGCGESFLLEDVEASDYRSQKDRRVEFLFFDEGEEPPTPLSCPPQIDRCHTKAECLLYNQSYFERTYIEPDHFNTTVYHSKFSYYNRIKNEICYIPDGVAIQVFDLTSEYVTQNFFSNGLYEIHVRNIPNGERKSDIRLTFSLTNAWIYTEDENSEPRIVYNFSEVDPALPNLPITRAELAKKPVAEQFCYYDLPEEWDSRNWQCKIDQTEGIFQDLVENMTSTTAPMLFNFDDIALIDATGSQDIKDKNKTNVAKVLDGDSRVSLYHIKNEKLELYTPEDINAPYFSKIDFTKNRILNPPNKSSVIAFANDFYTVNNLRTSGACDYTKGQILGARAAKINDTSKHFGEVLDDQNNTFGHQLFFAKETGNYQLHYFHGLDVVDEGGNKIPLSFLMVYWSARFVASAALVTATTGVPGAKTSAAYLNDYATLGMLNSKERWEHKGYTIEPNSNVGARNIIKPVFLFEGKKPDSGGKENCMATICVDPKKNVMFNSTSTLYMEDYKTRDSHGLGAQTDIDGNTYETLTVSHELGHATGKDDEYGGHRGRIKPADRKPQDGVFSQYYPGMPYYADSASMMCSNAAPRMRQYWFFVNWINEKAKIGGSLNPFLSAKEYKIVHRYGTKTLNYFLPSSPIDYRDIYRPAHFQRAVPTGTGSFDLSIYKLGEDETAYALKVGRSPTVNPWDSICVIYVKISIKFDYDKDAAGVDIYRLKADGTNKIWSVLEIDRWVDTFNRRLEAVQSQFYLKGTPTDNQNFKNGYIYFFPVFLPEPFNDMLNENALGALSPMRINLSADANYNITVNLNDTANVGTRGGKDIQVGNNTNISWIVKYLFGSDDGVAAPNTAAVVNKANLDTVRDWLRTTLASPSLTIEQG